MHTNNIEFNNVRIIYPDFLGEGQYNTYHRHLFNIIVSEEDAALMASSGLKIRYTKPNAKYPDPEPYTEITIAYSFMNPETGLQEPARNPPIITLHNLATGTDISVDESTLELLKANRLSNIRIAVTQSTPKINPMTGKLTSRFYLKELEADIVPFYTQG